MIGGVHREVQRGTRHGGAGGEVQQLGVKYRATTHRHGGVVRPGAELVGVADRNLIDIDREVGGGVQSGCVPDTDRAV